MLFGAISGSGTAAASAMGSIIGPIEEEEGYDRDFPQQQTLQPLLQDF